MLRMAVHLRPHLIPPNVCEKATCNHAGLWAGIGQVQTGGSLGLSSQPVKRVSPPQSRKRHSIEKPGTSVSTFVSQYTHEHACEQVHAHTGERAQTHTCMHTHTHTKLLPFYRYQRPTEQSWFIEAKKRDIYL